MKTLNQHEPTGYSKTRSEQRDKAKNIHRKSVEMHFKRHFNRAGCIDEDCCEDLKLRHRFARYHRFFLFSPLFLLIILILVFFMIQGTLSEDAHGFFVAIIVLIGAKEAVSVIISRRIYEHILRPVEDLKRGLFEVSRGNYGVEVKMSRAPEISDLIRAFNDMSQRLKASEIEKIKYEENRKALIASISHDLKTPITSINGFVDGILDGVADTADKQLSYIHIIQQNARYMNRLIDDLTLYSKLDLHKLNFEYVQLAINAYIAELFLELQLENEEYGIQMTLSDTCEKSVQLPIDPKQMTRAIRNIVANAVTYGRNEGASIAFKLFQKPDQVSLDISDNGPGISADQIDKIFERFYRGDDARIMASGSSGLGLAIAKEIIEAHGGSIGVISNQGSGTTIRIELPFGQEE